jgi:hypothetical protein
MPFCPRSLEQADDYSINPSFKQIHATIVLPGVDSSVAGFWATLQKILSVNGC